MIHARTTGQPSLPVAPRHQHNGDTRDPAKGHEIGGIVRQHGALLIFDEVVTGFRVAPGGAQQRLGARPDLTTLAKILAGGLPGGAVGGRAEIIDQIAFARARSGAMRTRVEHPGTFNANPLSAAAGIACLNLVATRSPTTQADRAAARLCDGLNRAFAAFGVLGFAYRDSSLVHTAPNVPGDTGRTPRATVRHRLRALRTGELARRLRLAFLNEGVDTMRGISYIVSAVHTDADIDHTVAGFTRALEALLPGRREGRPSRPPTPPCVRDRTRRFKRTAAGSEVD